jgi:hypothetical protein
VARARRRDRETFQRRGEVPEGTRGAHGPLNGGETRRKIRRGEKNEARAFFRGAAGPEDFSCICANPSLKIFHGQEKTCQEEGQKGRQEKEEVTF